MTSPNGAPDPAAMAAMRQAMMPQRWMCAVCTSAQRSWTIANADAIRDAATRAQQAGHPDPVPFLDPALAATIPQLSEAVTMATVPSHGPAAVCMAHCPPVAEAGRQPLLVATAGLNMGQFAGAMGQPR